MKVAEEQNKLTLPAQVRFAHSLDRFLSKSNPDQPINIFGSEKLTILRGNPCDLRKMAQ